MQSKISPKPSFAAIKMDSKLHDTDTIIVPETGKVIRGRIGKVMNVNLYPENQLYGFYDRKSGKIKSKKAYLYNYIYRDIIGKTVVIESGTGVGIGKTEDMLVMVRLEYIEAILPDDGNIEANESGVKRCSRCKSAGEGNIIMYHRSNGWFCPKCGKNDAGYTAEQVGAVKSRVLDEVLSGERRHLKGTFFLHGRL